MVLDIHPYRKVGGYQVCSFAAVWPSARPPNYRVHTGQQEVPVIPANKAVQGNHEERV